MNVWKYLAMAVATAMSSNKETDYRTHKIGAVGIRGDKVIVRSRNGAAQSGGVCPPCHAEARLARKMDGKSVVFVARVSVTGKIGLAKPCKHCVAALRSRGVEKAYYSIDENCYGTMTLR